MGKSKTQKMAAQDTPAEVPANVAEVPADDPIGDELYMHADKLTPAGEAKRGRGRPKNAERAQIDAECNDDNTLTLSVGALRVRYTPAGNVPFIPSASVITAEDARTMANVLSRLPAGNVDRDAFVTGIRAVGNLTLDTLVTVVNWHKRNTA